MMDLRAMVVGLAVAFLLFALADTFAPWVLP